MLNVLRQTFLQSCELLGTAPASADDESCDEPPLNLLNKTYVFGSLLHDVIAK